MFLASHISIMSYKTIILSRKRYAKNNGILLMSDTIDNVKHSTVILILKNDDHGRTLVQITNTRYKSF